MNIERFRVLKQTKPEANASRSVNVTRNQTVNKMHFSTIDDSVTTGLGMASAKGAVTE